MEINREDFVKGLAAEGYHNSESALVPLSHFLELAASGKYPLLPEADIDQELLKSTVTLTTGRAVSKVSFISLSQSFVKPDWMTKRAYAELMFEQVVNRSIRRSIGWTFVDLLTKVQREKIRVQFGDELGDFMLMYLFSECFGESITKVALDNCYVKVNTLVNVPLITKDVRDVLRNSIGEGLFMSIYYNFVFTLTGNQKAADELLPLVELWRKCWIVGFLEDERETLVAICA